LNLVDKLTDIYLNHETWHTTKLSKEEADRYHEYLLNNGNILSVSDGDILLGYVEFWRLSYEQFGRVICGEPFSAMHENVINGQIAYVANTYIVPEHRKGNVYKLLRNMFFETNKLCTHFCGEARRKSCAPVKVFKRNQALERV